MAGRLDDGSDLSEKHEINVTPFIDVMLVLLIIFMVAAPLSTVDVHVDLPVSTAKIQPRPDKPLYVTVKSDLSVSVGNDTIARPLIAQALDTATKSDREQRVFVRADKTVPYGEFMKVMNDLRTAGYLKIGLVGLENAPGTSGPSPASPPSAMAP